MTAFQRTLRLRSFKIEIERTKSRLESGEERCRSRRRIRHVRTRTTVEGYGQLTNPIILRPYIPDAVSNVTWCTEQKIRRVTLHRGAPAGRQLFFLPFFSFTFAGSKYK